jgi:hypothetical protein
MQALIWIQMVQFRTIWFSMDQFGTSHTNLRQPHIFKHQIYIKIFILHSSKYGIIEKKFWTFVWLQNVFCSFEGMYNQAVYDGMNMLIMWWNKQWT